jgi:hypothetical protein
MANIFASAMLFMIGIIDNIPGTGIICESYCDYENAESAAFTYLLECWYYLCD